MNITFEQNSKEKLEMEEVRDIIMKYLSQLEYRYKNILILPPDSSRKHSQAGMITNIIYNEIKDETNKVNIMPAIGTHNKMSEEELEDMFGADIPQNRFLVHDWRKDTKKIGEVPQEIVREISQNHFEESIIVKINEKIAENQFDKIISIGQVLPHEVVGMSNYTKNIVVGCGGKEIIDKSHYLGAVYGIENIIGRDHSPVRKLYDYIENNFLKEIPIDYILTVNKSGINEDGLSDLAGIFIGENRGAFNKAVKLSKEINIKKLDSPVEKFVVFLSPGEFKSTWVGNKAIYRTRLAINEGGELIIIAPGLESAGEDEEFDALIKKYGYIGKNEIVKLKNENKDLKNNLAVAAHLIHGSSESKFDVKYACNSLSKETIEKLNYNYIDLEEVKYKYDIDKLEEGYNLINDERIYYLENPAVGLWAYKENF